MKMTKEVTIRSDIKWMVQFDRQVCPICLWAGGFHDPDEHGWTRDPSTILEPGWYKEKK